MAVEFTFKPLLRWPREATKHRRRSPFQASYAKTLIDLERELGHLRAKSCIIEADCSADDIRLDGRIRSSASMRGPGIILRIETPTGWVAMPCDTYLNWTDNLRAIVLSLAALRAVDRYGVTKRAEQYQGWKQLPGGTGNGHIAAGEWDTVDSAARFLMDVARWQVPVTDILRNWRPCYLDASKRAHPDAGGSTELMAKVNRARDFIEAHQGAAV